MPVQGRKPKGYWDRLVNVRREIDTFCKEHNLPEGIVPLLQDFRRANRFDLTHAVERWGGLKELADLLEYEASILSCVFRSIAQRRKRRSCSQCCPTFKSTWQKSQA